MLLSAVALTTVLVEFTPSNWPLKTAMETVRSGFSSDALLRVTVTVYSAVVLPSSAVTVKRQTPFSPAVGPAVMLAFSSDRTIWKLPAVTSAFVCSLTV